MAHTHTIRAGDSLANIAFDAGLLVEMIWDHPDNAALRAKRPDMNMLAPGDQVVVPDKRRQDLPAATGQRHRFRLKGVPHVLRLQLFDDDEPRALERYELAVRGKHDTRTLSGTTDRDGVLTAYIPPGAISARLVIDEMEDCEPLTLDVLLGSLDPLEEWSGVQQRLANLGFDCPVDGTPSLQTTQAIAAFQRQFGLPETGALDGATRARLGATNDEVSQFPEEPPEP